MESPESIAAREREEKVLDAHTIHTVLVVFRAFAMIPLFLIRLMAVSLLLDTRVLSAWQIAVLLTYLSVVIVQFAAIIHDGQNRTQRLSSMVTDVSAALFPIMVAVVWFNATLKEEYQGECGNGAITDFMLIMIETLLVVSMRRSVRKTAQPESKDFA